MELLEHGRSPEYPLEPARELPGAFQGREAGAALRQRDFAPNIIELPVATSLGDLRAGHCWESKLALEFPMLPEYAEFTVNALPPVGATLMVIRVW